MVSLQDFSDKIKRRTRQKCELYSTIVIQLRFATYTLYIFRLLILFYIFVYVELKFLLQLYSR